MRGAPCPGGSSRGSRCWSPSRAVAELDIGGAEGLTAGVASEVGGETAAASSVSGQQWRSVRGVVAVTVEQQRHDDRPQVQSSFCDAVLVPVGSRVADHQQGPPFTHHLKRAGDRTYLPIVGASAMRPAGTRASRASGSSQLAWWCSCCLGGLWRGPVGGGAGGGASGAGTRRRRAHARIAERRATSTPRDSAPGASRPEPAQPKPAPPPEAARQLALARPTQRLPAAPRAHQQTVIAGACWVREDWRAVRRAALSWPP